jgi:class 3 adenylate cyclase/PAS domain-containing protein
MFFLKSSLLDRFEANNVFASTDGRFFTLLLLYQFSLCLVNAIVPNKIFVTSFGFSFNLLMTLYLIRFLPFYNYFVNFLFGVSFCFGLTFNLAAFLSTKELNLFTDEFSSLIFTSLIPFVLVFVSLFAIRMFTLFLKVKLTNEVEYNKGVCDYFTTFVDVDVEAHFALKYFGIEKAEIIFKNSMVKNPESMKIRIFYLLFLLGRNKNTEILTSLNTITSQMAKIKKRFILPDTKFLRQYCIQKRSEVSLFENLGEENGFVTIQMKKITKSMDNYFYWMIQFWKGIESKTTNYYSLTCATSSMNYYEGKCDSLFRKLFLDYPSNVKAYRYFADYLEKVKHQHLFADELYKLANSLEDHQSSTNRSKVNHSIRDRIKTRVQQIVANLETKPTNQIQPVQEKEIPLDSTPSESAFLQSNPIEIELNDLDYSNIIIDKMRSKANSNSETSDQMNIKAVEEMEVKDKNLLKKSEKKYYQHSQSEIQKEIPISFVILSASVIGFLFLSIAMISTSFGVSFRQIYRVQESIPIIGEAGSCRFSSSALSYFSRALQLFHGNQTSNIEKLKFHASFLERTTKHVYTRSLREEKVTEIWRDTSFTQFSELSGLKYNITLMDAHLMTILNTKKISNLQFYSKPVINESLFYFVNVNPTYVLVESYNVLIKALKEEDVYQQIVLFVATGVILIIFLFISFIFCLLMCGVSIWEIRHLKLFKQIQPSKVKEIIQKYNRFSSKNQEEILEKKSRYPVYCKLPVYSCIFFVLGALMMFSFLIIFSIDTSIFFETIENVDYSERRQYLNAEIRLILLEISSNQTYFSLEENRSHLNSYLTMLQNIHRDLRFGIDGSFLTGSNGAYPDIDKLHYQERCSNSTNFDCLSLHSMFVEIEKRVLLVLDNHVQPNSFYSELDILIEKFDVLLEIATQLFTNSNDNTFNFFTSLIEISFVVGVFVFICLYLILFFSIPFDFKYDISRIKLLLLELSVQDIFSNIEFQKHLNGFSSDKDSSESIRLDSLLKNTSSPIIKISDDLLINFANKNACRIFETPNVIFVGSHCKKFFEKKTLKEIQRFIESQDEYFSKEAQGVKPNRQLFTIQLTIHRITFGEDGKTFVAIIDDISEYQKKNEIIRKEREKSEEFLFNIFPSSIAKLKIADDEELISDIYEECSMLIAEIDNFEEMDSMMNSEEIIEYLNEFYSILNDISYKNNVEPIRKSAKSFTAACGIPVMHSDHHHEIIDFAIEINQAIIDLNKKKKFQLEMRIGISSGRAIGGVVGKKKYCFDIWGETVGIASKLTDYGIPGRIQISETTFEKVKKDYDLEKREIPDLLMNAYLLPLKIIEVKESKSQYSIKELAEKYPLNEILNSEVCLKYFSKYSSEIFCLENINFIKDIEKYKRIENIKERRSFANEIFQTYLSLTSKEEINVEQDDISAVRDNLEKCELSLFDKLEKEVMKMLRSENYHKFIYDSVDFKNMVWDLEELKFIDGKFNKFY